MDNEELLKKLRANLKLIEGIRTDDGYTMNQIVNIGKNSIKLLNQLQSQNVNYNQLINNAISTLQKIDSIERDYYDDPEYIKWIRKEQKTGKMNIFVKGVHCVASALKIFLSNVDH